MRHHDPTRGSILQRLLLTLLLAGVVLPALADEHSGSYSDSRSLSITEARWRSSEHTLRVSGNNAGRRTTVTLSSAATGRELTRVRADRRGDWSVSLRNPEFVPCSVQASANRRTAVRTVSNAPSNCDGATSSGGDSGSGDSGDDESGGGGSSGGGTDGGGTSGGGGTDGGGTSGGGGTDGGGTSGGGGTDGGGTSGGGGTTPPIAGDFQVLAFNDLGMHCADQDFREFSILPPYNVLNAQVVQKGSSPRLMSPADGIALTYQAVTSNIVDLGNPTAGPLATDSITSTAQNGTGLFKTNFWDATISGDAVGFLAYQSFYPPGVLASFAFEPDLGLPAPDLVELYLGGGTLQAEQSAMPGKDAPYSGNTPQPFNSYVADLPFFVSFPFGYQVTGLERYTAEGIPMSTVDDQGRNNAYPMLRVTAHDATGQSLASVDTVVPVASEADCQTCHTAQSVCDFDTTLTLVCDDLANMNYPEVAFLEDAVGVIGATPEQQVINAAKINILLLHDRKHGTALAPDNADGTNADGSTPNVVCASCHYSPALDLAHLGPNAEQQQHVSMSRAMHGFHGRLPQSNPADYGNLFPLMPPPQGRDLQAQSQLLEETCYNCHPGKRSLCLRGAMSGGGMVCQDCHGQLTQVGEDFTGNLPASHGSYDLSKRVPWASEPACQSCHLGDVLQADSLQRNGQLADTIVNASDREGNPDGLRLRMSYKVSDHKSNNGPDALQLLNFSSSRFASEQPLYRLSGNRDSGKGHQGIACEGCHGSTHAIWPNPNPWSNDNVTATQVQGHSGPITECTSCHTDSLGSTLNGPHGMHPVGDTSFSRGGHEHLAEGNRDACRACHGQNGEGSVLSRALADRTLSRGESGGNTFQLAKGTPVTCNLCHSNKL